MSAINTYRRNLPPGLVSGVLFFTVVFVGSAYIVYSKLEGVGAFFVTAVPVLIMIGYALLLGFARLFRLRDDQSGDNLYYMGFLFTLTSLGVSLYQFSTEEGAAEKIVQNFGVAIASTIAGIALRIFFNQMRRDPIEVEATARLELAEASRKVKRELESTVLEFAYFRRMAQQSIGDMLDEVKELLAEAHQDFAKDLREHAKSANRPLEEASERSGAALDSLQEKIGRTLDPTAQRLAHGGEQLTKSTVITAKALEELVAKLKSMQTPEQIIEIKLAPAIQGLTRAVNSFNKKATEHEEVIDEKIRQSQQLVSHMTAAVNDLVNELKTAQAAARDGDRPSVLPWGRGR